ncbi:MAG: hypothetical protein CSA05_02760 [Bacteroidia bacterium]|nr:MAG: hypothetical protein CSA05_02760 [Bacteroidia bacterium]
MLHFFEKKFLVKSSYYKFMKLLHLIFIKDFKKMLKFVKTSLSLIFRIKKSSFLYFFLSFFYLLPRLTIHNQ